MKYYGDFQGAEEVNGCFTKGYWGRGDALPNPLLVTDDEIIFAAYDIGDYQGHALVIFERDGKLYEVNGSHCSCMGLEGQWQPEETSWKALAMRGAIHGSFEHTPGALNAVKQLIQERLNG